LIVGLTSKCSLTICQGKSAGSGRFFRTEPHIFPKTGVTATFGLKKVPIRALYVVAKSKSEGAGGSVDRSWSSLELYEHANGRLVDLDVEAGEPERGPVPFVAKARPESQPEKPGMPSLTPRNDPFSFELFFVARSRGANGGLRRDHRLPTAARQAPGGSRLLAAQPQEATSAAEVFSGRVVQRILLENPALAGRTQPT
jgi:hypothetical protein